MIDLVRLRFVFFAASLLIIIPGLVYLLMFGLRLGIDFTGGTLWQVQFSRPVAVQDVRQTLSQAGYTDAIVQSFSPGGSNQSAAGPGTTTGESTGVAIRMREIREDSPQKAAVAKALTDRFGRFDELSFSSVGPAVGAEVARRSILAIALASIGILAYIAFAFRKVNHPLRYGVCAILAMLHDVLVVVGIYAILGRHFGVEVDALFVTALLTVIGFSVHDTIVVFDRIRENQLRRPRETFASIVNYSLIQTIVRSLNTSLTVLITLAALYVFGGVTIRNFVLALLIGIFSGTYSSIFNASMLLVMWENGEAGRLIGRRPSSRPAVPA